MPIYEYLCEACGTLTERIQKLTDPGPRTCPECGSRKVAKLVSRTSFQLKGGGWYADLYASPKADADKKGTHGGKQAAPVGPAEQAPAAPTAAAGADAPAAKAPPKAPDKAPDKAPGASRPRKGR